MKIEKLLPILAVWAVVFAVYFQWRNIYDSTEQRSAKIWLKVILWFAVILLLGATITVLANW